MVGDSAITNTIIYTRCAKESNSKEMNNADDLTYAKLSHGLWVVTEGDCIMIFMIILSETFQEV